VKNTGESGLLHGRVCLTTEWPVLLTRFKFGNNVNIKVDSDKAN